MENIKSKYTFYVTEHDPFEIVAEHDAKSKFWDAKKCNYPTFEIEDVDGNTHVFVTSSILVLECEDI